MTQKDKKNILIIGNYADFYPRNYLIIDAFKSKFDVKDICLWEEKRKKYLFFLNLFKFGKNFDYILILKEGQKFVFILALYKILFFWRSKIIFDAFISYYDTYVFDRKTVGKYSLHAFYNYLLDFLSCRVGDILVFDTLEHKEYFFKTFKIGKNKRFIVLPLPVDLKLADKTRKIKRKKDLRNKFLILFYGQYIPLQGVEHIIEAASILRGIRNIHFVLIGSGQTKKNIDKLYNKYKLTNITFLPRMSFKEIIAYTKTADLCLGIFGNTDKANRVVPNKVVEQMACSKIVISAKNKALEEFFKDKKDIIYCQKADEKDLAEKIELVYNNYNDFVDIGKNAREKIEKYFSKQAIEKIIDDNFYRPCLNE